MKNPEIVGSILIGSVIIATGLFFELRRSAPTPAEPLPTQINAMTAPATGGAAPNGAGVTAGRPGVSAPAAATARTTKDVAAALAKLAPALRAKCWDTLAADKAAPQRVKLTWNGTIGPDGKAKAFGVSEHREAYRAGVAKCVSDELLSMTVPPPVEPVEVTVDFELP